MRRSGGLLPALILGGLVLAGCGPQAGPPTTTASPGASTAPNSSVPSAPTAAPPTTASTPAAKPTATAPKASWSTFTTADGQLAFDHPSGWSVRDPAGELPEGGGAFAEVSNEAGRPLATLRTNMAIGSTCMEKYPYSEFESQELPALAQSGTSPRFFFETRG